MSWTDGGFHPPNCKCSSLPKSSFQYRNQLQLHVGNFRPQISRYPLWFSALVELLSRDSRQCDGTVGLTGFVKKNMRPSNRHCLAMFIEITHYESTITTTITGSYLVVILVNLPNLTMPLGHQTLFLPSRRAPTCFDGQLFLSLHGTICNFTRQQMHHCVTSAFSSLKVRFLED